MSSHRMTRQWVSSGSVCAGPPPTWSGLLPFGLRCPRPSMLLKHWALCPVAKRTSPWAIDSLCAVVTSVPIAACKDLAKQMVDVGHFQGPDPLGRGMVALWRCLSLSYLDEYSLPKGDRLLFTSCWGRQQQARAAAFIAPSPWSLCAGTWLFICMIQGAGLGGPPVCSGRAVLCSCVFSDRHQFARHWALSCHLPS